jgi:hypothetical protein
MTWWELALAVVWGPASVMGLLVALAMTVAVTHDRVTRRARVRTPLHSEPTVLATAGVAEQALAA